MKPEEAFEANWSDYCPGGWTVDDRRLFVAGWAAALRAQPSNDAEGWRDIASAPKDGTVIDIWADGERIADAYWQGGPKRGGWWAPNNDYDGADGLTGAAPTHWRPLPAAPATLNPEGSDHVG